MDSKQQSHRPSPKPQGHSFESNGSKPSKTVLSIDLDLLLPPAGQPRRYFDAEAMEQLIASIKSNGLLQPLLVRPVGDKYEVVAGERRYKAARAVGLTEVPVHLREMTDAEAMQCALVENLQRQDLNPVEETEGILQLLALELNCSVDEVKLLLYRMKNSLGKGSKGTDAPADNSTASAPDARGHVSPNPEREKVEAVFTSLGKMNWQTFIRTRLPLLKLPPEILEALRQGRIEYTKAKAIAKLKLESARQALLEQAIAQSLSLREIRELLKAQQLPPDREELQSRMERLSKRVKQIKLWDDLDKRTRLEALLADIEALLSEDPGSV